MPTTNIIVFRSKNEVIQIFRMHDGYRDSSIILLQEFLKWNGKRNEQLGHTVCNFVHWYKTKNKEYSNSDYMNKIDVNDHAHTGLSLISLGIPIRNFKQAREEYGAEAFWIIDLDKKTIKEIDDKFSYGFEPILTQEHFDNVWKKHHDWSKDEYVKEESK